MDADGHPYFLRGKKVYVPIDDRLKAIEDCRVEIGDKGISYGIDYK